MPMIEAKVTMELPAEKRNVLKAEFGKAISIMGKPESYLMINLVDGQDLYFGGNKLEKVAYVEVKVLGSVDAGAGTAGIFRRVIKTTCHLPIRQFKNCQIAE